MNKKYKSILLDVDGTLIFSHTGLLNGHKYALKHIGMPQPNEKTLLECVGPAPMYSLKEILKIPEDKLELAYILNRGYVYTRGYKEYEVIPGMPELVEDLYKAGYKLYTASTKAEWLCELCIESMGLSRCFEKVCGAGNDGTSRTTKAEVINYAKECGAEDCIIIGDRKFDIEGANKCDIDSLGITFGYGTAEELSEHNPTYICNSADDIRKILL